MGVNAQDDCDPDVTTTIYDAFCANTGRIVVTVNNPEKFGNIAYGLTNSDGIVIVPIDNGNNVLSGLSAGTYTLTVTAACRDDEFEAPPRQKVIPNLVVKPGETMDIFEVFPNIRNSINNSFHAYHSAQAAFDILGGTGYYTVTMIEKPAAYTGPTTFDVTQPGLFIVKNLAPGNYRFEFNDGCNLAARIRETIGTVAGDDVPNLASFFTNSTIARATSSKNSYPSDENKVIYIDLTLGTFNVHEYLSYEFRDRAAEFYEVAFSYNSNASSIPESGWRDFTLDGLNRHVYKFEGNYYYSEMLPPNNTAASGRLPYVYIRLKGAPQVVKRYDNLRTSFVANPTHNLTSSPASAGLAVTVNPLVNHASKWLSLPYKVRATSGSQTIEILIEAPSDTSNDELYKIDPKFILPYPATGSQTWNIQFLPADGGDPGINFRSSPSSVIVYPKSRYFSPEWEPIVSRAAINKCGSTEVPSTSGFIQYDLNSGIPKINGQTVTYPKIVKRFIRAESAGDLPPDVLTEVESSFNQPGSLGIFLLSNTNSVFSDKSSQLAPGRYTWEIDLYAEETDTQPSGTSKITVEISANNTLPHARIKDGAELKFYRVPLSGGECRGYKVMFKMSELRQLVEKRNSPTQAYSRGDVVIRLFKKTGLSWDPTSAIEADNFTMTGGNLTQGYFHLSELENNSSLTGKDPVFNITTDGVFAFQAQIYYDTSIEKPSFTPRATTSIDGYYNGRDCYPNKEFEIITGYDNRTSIDPDRTGAFRCSSGELGELRINLINPPVPGFYYTYTITAVDQNGAPTGVPIPGGTFTSDQQENVINTIPVGVDYVKVGIVYEQCVDYPSSYVLPVYDLTSPSIIRYSLAQECDAGTHEYSISSLSLFAAYIFDATYEWFYPDGTKIEDVYGGNTRRVEILPNNKLVYGIYKCIISTDKCANSPVTHNLDVTSPPIETYYWNPSATNNSWASASNWLNADGNLAGKYPDACNNVVIPGYFINSKYPSATTTSQCRDITFEFGGKLAAIHNLTYRNAFTEYNYGYYSLETPAAGSSPDLNASNIFTITQAPVLERGRWYGLAAPLKGAEFGDFQAHQEPYTFGALFNKHEDHPSTYVFNVNKGGSADQIVTTVLNNPNLRLADTQNGFMMWVPKYADTKGARQTTLNSQKGKFVYPSKDKFIKFDMDTQAEAEIPRSGVFSGRFVIEGNLSENQFSVTIPADPDRTSPYIMLGNPFMAPIRLVSLTHETLASFYNYNKDNIEKEFYLVQDADLVEITETHVVNNVIENKYAAPLQGFVVKLKNGLDVTGSYEFKFNIGIQEAAGVIGSGLANLKVK